MPEKPKKPRVDRQLTGLAGEFFVAAELLKRGIQTSVTLGNAKSIDLLAHNLETGQNFTVQVKSLREKNYFPIRHSEINSSHIYVFVLLNPPNRHVQYFVVPGCILENEQVLFGKGFQDPTFPGIHPKELSKFENEWGHFGLT